jgi:hypothetical protein
MKPATRIERTTCGLLELRSGHTRGLDQSLRTVNVSHGLQTVKNFLFGPGFLDIDSSGLYPNHRECSKRPVFELAHYGLFVASKENDYLLVHSFQSLFITLLILIAAPRSHLAFRFARSRWIALIVLWLPR